MCLSTHVVSRDVVGVLLASSCNLQNKIPWLQRQHHRATSERALSHFPLCAHTCMCVCMCCVCVCTHACVCCMCMCEHACVCVCVCAFFTSPHTSVRNPPPLSGEARAWQSSHGAGCGLPAGERQAQAHRLPPLPPPGDAGGRLNTLWSERFERRVNSCYRVVNYSGDLGRVN